MEKYKMNLATATLTISKEFAANAMIPNSEESAIIERSRALCPNLKITYFSRRPSSGTHATKGITYTKMESYIRLHDNADELFAAYITVKAIASLQKNPYIYVYKWFAEQFPDFKALPELVNGKLHVDVIGIEKTDKNLTLTETAA